MFTGAVVAILVMLSIILTAATLFPDITAAQIVLILIAGSSIGLLVTFAAHFVKRRQRGKSPPTDRSLRDTWRMPPLEQLATRPLTLLDRVWMGVLRAYLVLAAGLVLVRIVSLALGSRA